MRLKCKAHCFSSPDSKAIGECYLLPSEGNGGGVGGKSKTKQKKASNKKILVTFGNFRSTLRHPGSLLRKVSSHHESESHYIMYSE